MFISQVNLNQFERVNKLESGYILLADFLFLLVISSWDLFHSAK